MYHWFQLWNKKVITWQASLGYRTLQFAAQLSKNSQTDKGLRQILSMQWVFHESGKLFSGSYLELYFARRCKTQQNCKQTVKHIPWWLERFTHYRVTKIVITKSLNLRIICEWNPHYVQQPEKKAISTDMPGIKTINCH